MCHRQQWGQRKGTDDILNLGQVTRALRGPALSNQSVPSSAFDAEPTDWAPDGADASVRPCPACGDDTCAAEMMFECATIRDRAKW